MDDAKMFNHMVEGYAIIEDIMHELTDKNVMRHLINKKIDLIYEDYCID
jgi:hypothetical protein